MFQIASDLSDHRTAVDEFSAALLAGLEDTPPTAAVLEIGVYHGGSTLFILWHILDERKGRQFLTVDHGGEGDDSTMRGFEKQWGKSSRIHYEMDQHEWIKDVLPTLGVQFGFVYLDGEHGDASIAPDITGIAPYMVTGATLAIDDAHECSQPVLDFPGLGLERVQLPIRQRGCGEIAFYRKVDSL